MQVYMIVTKTCSITDHFPWRVYVCVCVCVQARFRMCNWCDGSSRQYRTKAKTNLHTRVHPQTCSLESLLYCSPLLPHLPAALFPPVVRSEYHIATSVHTQEIISSVIETPEQRRRMRPLSQYLERVTLSAKHVFSRQFTFAVHVLGKKQSWWLTAMQLYAAIAVFGSWGAPVFHTCGKGLGPPFDCPYISSFIATCTAIPRRLISPSEQLEVSKQNKFSFCILSTLLWNIQTCRPLCPCAKHTPCFSTHQASPNMENKKNKSKLCNVYCTHNRWLRKIQAAFDFVQHLLHLQLQQRGGEKTHRALGFVSFGRFLDPQSITFF